MTKEQKNHFNRDGDVQGFAAENQGQFKPEEEYIKIKEALDIAMADLRNLLKTQDELELNSAETKDVARENATPPLFQLANVIYSMAFATGNISLMEKVRITLSELKRLSDTKLLFRFENFISAGAEYLPSLLTYGVTEETLNSNTAFVNTFGEELKKYSRQKNDHKEVTKQIKLQFKAVDNCIVPFDNMVENKRVSDPAWYSLYWTIRTIDHSPASHVSVKAKVYDAETNQPLPGTILTYSKIETNGKALTSGPDLSKTVKVKSAGGGLDLKSLTTGAYLFTVSYAGRADMQTTVYVNEGVLTRIDFPLNKIA